MNTYAENSAPRARVNPPLMFSNGVSSRIVPGQELAGRAPVAGSSENGGGAAPSPRGSRPITDDAPITPSAAIAGQRSFWKYVSTPIARARTARRR